jgi:hypothetical protein
MLLGGCAGVVVLGAAPAAARPKALVGGVLPQPVETTAFQTLEVGSVAIGVAPADDQVVAVAANDERATAAPFAPKGKTHDEVFGAPLARRRVELPVKPLPGDWRSVLFHGGRVVLFDGSALALSELDGASFAELQRRSIPWDLAKPPADSRGEPTSGEVAAWRAAFKAAYLAAKPPRAAGVAPVPASFAPREGGRLLLVALRVAGHPLGLMRCDVDEASSCQLVRECYLEGAKDLDPTRVFGIGVDPERRLVALGDGATRRVRVFRFDTCYHVPAVASWLVPPRLPTPVGLAVDGKSRLWLTTRKADDQWAASAFYWPRDVWVH